MRDISIKERPSTPGLMPSLREGLARTLALAALLVILLARTTFAAAPAAASCEGLATLSLPHNTSITLAQAVPAGGFTPPTPANAPTAQPMPNLPGFCRI